MVCIAPAWYLVTVPQIGSKVLLWGDIFSMCTRYWDVAMNVTKGIGLIA